MKKLIELDAALDAIGGVPDCDDGMVFVALSHAQRDVARLPIVEAVQVVRCKDCKWGQKVSGNIECFADRNAPPEYHGYDWYCPNGERRTDE